MIYTVKPQWNAELKTLHWLVRRGAAVIAMERNEARARTIMNDIASFDDPWLKYNDERQVHFNKCYGL